MPDTKETFPRPPSNEQTMLTELGEARRQLAEIKEIDAKMCADYSTMVEQLAEMKASEIEINADALAKKDAENEEIYRHLEQCRIERDALAVTVERLRGQVARLRESLETALEWYPGWTEEFNLPDCDKARLAAARAILKETAQ